jgi:hypothetical protein
MQRGKRKCATRRRKWRVILVRHSKQKEEPFFFLFSDCLLIDLFPEPPIKCNSGIDDALSHADLFAVLNHRMRIHHEARDHGLSTPLTSPIPRRPTTTMMRRRSSNSRRGGRGGGIMSSDSASCAAVRSKSLQVSGRTAAPYSLPLLTEAAADLPATPGSGVYWSNLLKRSRRTKTVGVTRRSLWLA